MSPSLPVGLEPLLARGVVFGRKVEHGIELVLPTAFLLQLKSWEGEDPRALRALLAQAPFETLSAVASHYLGRPANPPIALSLEPAWEQLSEPERLREEIEKVPPVERRLLESIVRTDVLVREHAPLLSTACEALAALSVRNLATLGGNVGWGSGDALAALMALDAQAELADGTLQPLPALLALDELPLLVALHVPLGPPTRRAWFEKIGHRQSYLEVKVTAINV